MATLATGYQRRSIEGHILAQGQMGQLVRGEGQSGSHSSIACLFVEPDGWAVGPFGGGVGVNHIDKHRTPSLNQHIKSNTQKMQHFAQVGCGSYHELNMKW